MIANGVTWWQLLWVAALVAVIVPMLRASIGGAPFLPTPWPVARRMAELAKIGPTSRVVDPGCGDGRLLVACLERGAASATGYELFLLPYLWARLRALRWKGRMRVRFRDARSASFTDSDVLVCYLLPGPLLKMRPRMAGMPAGARVVSYTFSIGGWIPSHTEPAVPAEGDAPIHVYTIGTGTPAEGMVGG